MDSASSYREIDRLFIQSDDTSILFRLTLSPEIDYGTLIYESEVQ